MFLVNDATHLYIRDDLWLYIRYGEQLSHTPWHFKIFVPDSPTAILYLVISITLILIQKQNSIIDAWAFVTLFKYGDLQVIMNILFIIEQGDITVRGLVQFSRFPTV